LGTKWIGLAWQLCAICGVYKIMSSFLARFRWALVLAAVQGTIFATTALMEHARQTRFGHPPKGGREYFGCFALPHAPMSEDERWDTVIVDCWPPLHIKFVILTNLPVVIIWAVARDLTAHQPVNQFWLFYSINGIGIPLFWFWVGSLIDRRLLRHEAAIANPPV
jgi:hypothetical protein